MTIGERIKKLRQLQHRTQQSIADALNLKRQTIAAYEIGTVAPSDRTIFDICREFNVNERWLRTGEGDMFNPSPETEIEALARKYKLSDISRFIIEGYLRLDENDRAVFDRHIRNLFDEWHSRIQPSDAEIEAEAERYKRELYAQRDAEFAKETTPDLATMRVVDRDEEEEKLIARGVELMREQFKLEKKQEA